MKMFSKGESATILVGRYCHNSHTYIDTQKCVSLTPNMVDHQWNMWYWGSRRIFSSVCWGAVGCEWRTTSIYFGITYARFIPRILPVTDCPSNDIIFISKISFERHKQNLKKTTCGFKNWLGFVGQILIKLEKSFFRSPLISCWE